MFHTSAISTKSLQLVLIAVLATAATAAAGVPAPTLSKVFTPNVIGPGSVSTITLTIANGSASTVTGLAFTDTLPAAITLADPAIASTTCDLGVSGTLTAPDGGSTITLSDAQIGAGSSCTVTVDVTASTPGAHTNPAVTLSSSAGSSMSLPVDLTVATTLPGFSKSFAPSSVDLGERSTLTFTIDNSANASNVQNLDFVDNFPAGMVIADPAAASTTCGTAILPPTLFAAPGTGSIVLDANGTLAFPAVAAGATCTVTVDVVATGAGMLDNLSGDLLATFVSAGKASDTLEVTVSPLTIRKSFTDDPVPPGGTVTLEFTIDNFDRLFSATGVAFTDDLTALVPALAGLTFDSLLPSDCGGSVSGIGGTTIGFTGGTLAPEASCTIRVSLAVPAGATPGVYTNTTGAVTATVDGSPVVGNMASDDLFVGPVPILTKEFLEVGTLAPDPVVNPGDDVVLRFTVTNTSTASMATDVAFFDELTNGGPNTGFLPSPVTVSLPPTPDPPCGAGSSLALVLVDGNPDRQALSLTGGNLTAAPGAGAMCTFDVTVSIPAGLAAGIYTNTTEEITATVDGATRTGDPASDTLTVIAAPTLTKEFTDDPVAPGGTVTVEFTLTYPADASGDATAITFTDNLAPVLAGLTANLPPTPDPPCGAGSSLTGSAGDTLLTFMGGTLMPGESCAFTVTLDVPAGATPGTYPNTTSGVGATVQGLPATSAPASDDLTVAGLTLAKEFLGDPALPGQTVTLRFTFENVSPTDDATSIAFNDNLAAVLPGGTDLTTSLPPAADTCNGTPGLIGTNFFTYGGGSLMVGMTCMIEIDVDIPFGVADGSYINTTSSFTSQIGGSPYTGPPATDVLTIDSNLLQLTKAFTDDPVAPGDPVTLELTLTNLDPGNPATDVGFTDDLGAALPGLTFDSVIFEDCTGETISGLTTTLISVSTVSLPAGGSCTLRMSLTVPGAAAAGIYTNTTSAVEGTIGGLGVSGDPASDDLEVIQLLQFSKSFDGPTTATGMATLTFTITNPGAATATDISFSDDLDAVISGLIAISLPAVPCGAGSSITGVGFLTFSGGELPPMGGMCSFDVDVLVPASATAGTFPNTTSDLFKAGLVVADPATADLVIEPPPTFAKVFAPDFVGFGQSSTLTFTIDNSASALAASSLAFIDNLPAGLAVATPSITANTCGGTLTATAGTGVISSSGGSVGAGATCTVQVDVTAGAVGALVNTTGDLTSTSGNSGTASDTLTVNPQPGFAKSFAPNPIVIGGTSTLTFTVDNTASTVAATGLSFTDNLPAAVTVATPANVVNTCGGAVTATSGTGIVALAGGTVSMAASCTLSVDVTSSTAGLHVNLSGNLTSSLGTSGTATDTLTVFSPPGFSKSFSPDTIAEGDVSMLTFTIDNTASPIIATALDFTDNLPAAVTIATPANVVNTCGGTVTATSGTSVVSLSGGTALASSSCTLSVDVTSSTVGMHVNLTGDLTSSNGNSGTATDTLTVNPPKAFSKSFAPNPIAAGSVSVLTFTIDNTASTADATGLDFTDNLPAGVVVATPPNAATTCTGGTLTAVAGSGVITYTGGTVSALSSCTISVDVTSAAAGSYVNVTSDLTSSNGNSGTATDTLDVIGSELGISKTFAVFPVPPLAGGGPDVLRGGFVIAEYTITNVSLAFTAIDVAFSDDLDAALPGLTALGLPVANVCGVGSQIAGTSVVTLTGGSLPPDSSCIISIVLQVPAGAPLGMVTSTTGAVTGELSGVPVTGAPASADLEVVFVDFTKEFGAGAAVGSQVTLTFTLVNPDPGNGITDLVFTDDLSAVLPGLEAIDLPQNDVCGAGSMLTGTTLIALTGGSLGPNESCAFAVTLQIPTTAEGGEFDNVTSVLEGTVNALVVVGDPAGAAIDTLDVQGTPLDIPTLTGWGLLALCGLLALLGVRRLRHHHPAA